ncbi:MULTISPECIES: hypothetical protein [unclassified Bradyrhizobium]|uniref:hypothetical protein n=1 Tax=unclassified Bradyrhizobium TaxID=2631580 RepID=UPI00339B1E96
MTPAFLNALRDKPKHLVSELMTIFVVEFLEVVYIDQKNAEGLSYFHNSYFALQEARFLERGGLQDPSRHRFWI